MKLKIISYFFIMIIFILLVVLALTVNDWQVLGNTFEEKISLVIMFFALFIIGMTCGAEIEDDE